MTRENDIILPVLRILTQTETGMLRTAEVRRRVRASIRLTPDDLCPLRNRSDQRIDQTIRNLKSHKNVPGNPFYEGWLKDVPRGYAITELGKRIAAERSGL